MSLQGQKLVQVWQWNPGVQAQRTVADVIQVCRTHGFTGMLVKALDGAAWMSNFDPSSTALRSVDDVRRQADEAHAAGLTYSVWTNPLDTDIAVQASLTAALANTPGVDAVFLDAEPYNQFWGAWRPVGRAREFMERIRQAAPDAYIVLQPDPRPARLAELRPDEWRPYVNALAGQHYFNTFQVDPVQEMGRAITLSQQWNLPIYPTLPGNAPVNQLSSAIQTLLDGGVGGCVMWRLGSAGTGQLKTIGQAGFAKLPDRTDLILEGADPVLNFRFTEAEALAFLQSQNHQIVPEFAIAKAAITAYRLGLPYLNPGPAIEDEHQEAIDGKIWAVQRFANLAFKWSGETGVLLHPNTA